MSQPNAQQGQSRQYWNADFYSNQKLLVIPQDPVAHEILLAVDRKTQFDVGKKYSLRISRDWETNTVANVVLESVIRSLALQTHVFTGNSKDVAAALNFYDLLYMKATNRTTADADKEGNINVKFGAGPRALELITMPEFPEVEAGLNPLAVFTLENDPEMTELFKSIDKKARYELSRKYRIIFMDDLIFATIAILDQFLLNLFEYLLCDLGNSDKTRSSVNLNDNIEIHATRDQDNNVKFMLRPGMNAKLIIKSDDITERDDDEEDE